jgi:hypothetical protein
MKPFSNLPPVERALIINEAAGRLGLVPFLCWGYDWGYISKLSEKILVNTKR